ncbi:MAG: cyclic nucleotide-binding domain-containing protein [Planctomycetota bacterium]
MSLDAPNLLKMLHTTRFAEGLPHAELTCLGRASRLVEAGAGTVLFREGQVEDEVFVVFSGHVRLSMKVPGRGEVTLLTAGPGDLVGWSGLISDGVMTATATVLDSARLVALSGRCLQQLCESDPKLGYILMKRMAQVISRRLLSTRLQLLDLFADAAEVSAKGASLAAGASVAGTANTGANI